MSEAAPDRDAEVAHRAPDRRSAFGIRPRLQVAQPLEQRFDLFLALGEMRFAFVGDLEGFARTLARRFLDQAHVLQQGQRRIDHARTRRIFAAGQLLDRADEVVAVPRLVGAEFQEDEAKFAALEHPARPASTTATALAFVAEVEVERTPITLPAP